MLNEFICKGCNEYCCINIDKSGEYIELKGNLCDKAFDYVENKIKSKKDIFTSLVRIKGACCNVVPVKSNKPLDKSLWLECSKALSMLHVGAPIKMGDIVCHNLLNTGIDIICTKNVSKQ